MFSIVSLLMFGVLRILGVHHHSHFLCDDRRFDGLLFTNSTRTVLAFDVLASCSFLALLLGIRIRVLDWCYVVDVIHLGKQPLHST